MKWGYEAKKVPEFGSTRLATKLAIFPKACNKNHKHWFEFVFVRQWRGSRNWWPDAATTCICPESVEAKAFIERKDDDDV